MSSAASSHDRGPGEFRLGHSLAVRLATLAALCGQGLLLLLSVALLARWLGGAMEQAAPAAVIFATALILAGLGVSFRAALACGAGWFRSGANAWTAALFAVPTVSSLFVLASFIVPGVSALALLCAWAIVMAAEALSWLYFQRQVSGSTVAGPSVAAVSAAVADEASEPEEELPGDVFQELTRTRHADGSEVLSATVRIDFPAGDRVQVVHLAFCPPFGRLPQMEMEQQDGAEAELRATSVQAFGARIEARLVEASEQPQFAIVQVYAATEPAGEPAE